MTRICNINDAKIIESTVYYDQSKYANMNKTTPYEDGKSKQTYYGKNQTTSHEDENKLTPKEKSQKIKLKRN
jgi:hypothetical protein